jgi:PEP-CTERM motif
MKTKASSLVAGIALTTFLGVGVCNAATIIFNVNQTIGAGSVTGTIQTDGATGVLGQTDVTGWNLQLNGVGATLNLTNNNSHVFLEGSDVTATATNLFFNYSGGDQGYLLFQINFGSAMQYTCDATANSGVCSQGASVVPQTISNASAQFASVAGNQIIGTAAVAGVPEPATWAMMLLGFAGLGFAFRKSRRASFA